VEGRVYDRARPGRPSDSSSTDCHCTSKESADANAAACPAFVEFQLYAACIIPPVLAYQVVSGLGSGHALA
jgi:hypothetical protein